MDKNLLNYSNLNTYNLLLPPTVHADLSEMRTSKFENGVFQNISGLKCSSHVDKRPKIHQNFILWPFRSSLVPAERVDMLHSLRPFQFCLRWFTQSLSAGGEGYYAKWCHLCRPPPRLQQQSVAFARMNKSVSSWNGMTPLSLREDVCVPVLAHFINRCFTVCLVVCVCLCVKVAKWQA